MSSRRWPAVLVAVLALLAGPALSARPAAAAGTDAAPAVTWSSPADGEVVQPPQVLYAAITRTASAEWIEVLRVAPGGAETLVERSDQRRAPGVAALLLSTYADGPYHVRLGLVDDSGAAQVADLRYTVDAGAARRPALHVGDISAETSSAWTAAGDVGYAPDVSRTTWTMRLQDSVGLVLTRSGQWSGTFAGAWDVSSLADGPVTVSLSLPDLSGVPTAQETVLKDTVPPSLLTSSVAIAPDGRTVTWRARPDAAGAHVRLALVDRFGQRLDPPAVVAAGDGSAAPLAPVDVRALADGPLTGTLAVTDGVNAVTVPVPPLRKHEAETVDEAHDRFRAAGLDLGAPTGPEQQAACEQLPPPSRATCHGGVVWRPYERGEVLTGPGRVAHEVHGALDATWRASGGPTGPWGLPQSDEGAAGPARVSAFDGGRAYWSPSGGTWLVSGDALTSYLALGGPAGPLGPPSGGRAPVVLPPSQPATDVVAQPFVGGRVYLVPGRAPLALYGALYARSRQLGGDAVLGLPYTEEQPAVGGGRTVRFSGLRIVWGPSTGTVALRGPLMSLYESTPLTDLQQLGLPVAEESAVAASGVGVRQVRFQGGALVFAPPVGGRPLYGAMLASYDRSAALLKVPVTHEGWTQGPVGAREQSFLGGRVYWSSGTGAHALHDGILAAYVRGYGPGMHDTRLGLPLTDEYVRDGVARVDFEYGTIRWTSRGAVVTYRR